MPDLIATERLILRPLTPEDAAPTARLMTPGIARWTGSWRGTETAQAVMERIVRYQATERLGRSFNRVIERSGNGALIGWIGGRIDDATPRRGSIGYWIGEPFFGLGYTKEAAAALLPHLWDALNVDVIEGVVQVPNIASIAILKGLGMRRVGQRLEFASARGVSDLCEVFEIERPR
jgi:ribosomal-protein-alanine N-acetyltransferase